MEAVKKIKIDLKYNKYNVTKDFSKYLQSITYTDYEEESSDELSVQLRDNEKLFQNEWYPEKGAKLTCVLGFTNSREQLNCGTFTIDENRFNFSSSEVSFRKSSGTFRSEISSGISRRNGEGTQRINSLNRNRSPA